MVTAKEFEDKKIFEGCMPIEVMAERGRDTMRFGPLKPVGLKSPKTGKLFYAVVQLRAENVSRTCFNMVGFQTRLKQPEQIKVFRMIPGLSKSKFLRYGSIHRNTFINSPVHLTKDLTLINSDNTMLAGQITGVEGYIESTAMGLLAGIFASNKLKGKIIKHPSITTAHGALLNYITNKDHKNFQPSNINFGLFPELEQHLKDKHLKKEAIVKKALEDWEAFINETTY
ncbi:MAG: methylenetetrahydrofolate--tRNA-(uracil(54)-C(5))-methyltransferase (FADH(2)-oxidizing) TrmFO [Nitrospirae bacterium]|nr:methylenetetrahydrofolate--tRNA-(uracil(54)-C(5))-methyltransferase (FADH(2)-oxidizing) TrmFO [Nitrospirota bacterium]